MRKVKLLLPTGEWDNLVTKYAPDDLRFISQNAFTDGTKNIETDSDGTIRKIKGGTQFATVPTVSKDQYEAIFSDGTRHLLIVENGNLRYTAGSASFSLVTSGYSTGGNFEFATTQDRVYFGNSINSTQVYDKATSYGGVSYSAPQTKVAGAQAPGSAPTAGAPTTGGSVPDGAHTYKITFLYYDSEESNGSAASGVQTCGAGNNTIPLSSIPTGGYGVTARKIYRDDNDGNYVLIDTLSNNTTTTYNDTAIGGTTPIPTDNGIPPVAGQITLYLDRLWFAQVSGDPYTLFFSEVGLPDIVESTNFIDCNQEDPITGLAVYRGRLVVFNRRSMGQILGDTKDTFRYDPIQGSVGCVDNRTIQEIVYQGVPTLIWLSDKGFYGFNGSSISCLSDSIENIINSDIQQSVIQRNESTDTTNTDFNAGTASDGILVQGGAVTTRGYDDGSSTTGTNPRRTWNDTNDWDNGSSLTNIATIGLPNTMQAVTNLVQSPGTEGTRDNLDVSGSNVTINVESDFTGETSIIAGSYTQVSAGEKLVRGYYQRIIPEKSGQITQVRVSGKNTQPSTTFEIGIMAEAGGLPDRATKLASVEVATGPTTTPPTFINATVSYNVTAGTAYWIYQEVRAVDNLTVFNMPFAPQGSYLSGDAAVLYDEVGFQSVTNVFSGQEFAPAMDYTMVQDPIATSGQWRSEIYDTQSDSADAISLLADVSFTTGQTVNFTLIAGDSLDISNNINIDESETFIAANPSPAFTVTLGSRRYWQVIVELQKDDDRVAGPTLEPIELNFNNTGEWISEAIDTTGDSTVYNDLTTNASAPTGTSVTTEIRTATTSGGLTSAPWVSFGSHTVRQWAQIRLTLTKDATYLLTPTVTSLNLDWTIVANLVSSAIDTAANPSGWDIFQTDFDTNGGTVVFEMRSATTSGGLTGATWYTVTNGNFPTSSLPTEQWVQWRVTLTSTDGNVPETRSVTIRWFEGDVSTIRAASIFHDKGYYVALAEFGNDANNIILKLDENGKWRLKRGLGISTFSFFFNEPYFGLSTAGTIGKFLQGLQDLGSDIEVDIRTRAFDFSNQIFDNSDLTKVLESVTIEGRGTGTAYTVSYSLDEGNTFTNLIDIQTGSTSFTTTDDDRLFARVFHADHSDGQVVSAKTIMFRVNSNDEYDVKLHRLKATVYLTLQPPIITG